jgi:hypothetical protein
MHAVKHGKHGREQDFSEATDRRMVTLHSQVQLNGCVKQI